jgi:sulfur carrier protein ThiS
MKVDLRLFASLARYSPDKGNSPFMEIKEGTRVADLLEQLKVPPDSVKLIFINGVHASGDVILKDGDRLGVFPPVAGG